jgi:cysteine synthase A
VADPENSVFLEAFESGDRGVTSDRPSRIEGIGRPRVEPSFLPGVIDRMMRVPDAASIATLHVLEELLNRRVGGSTGTNVFAAFRLMSEMHARGVEGSVVTLICDGGERYRHSYYSEDWLRRQGLELEPWLEQLRDFQRTGRLAEPPKTTEGEDR